MHLKCSASSLAAPFLRANLQIWRGNSGNWDQIGIARGCSTLGKPIVSFGTADGEIDRNGSILRHKTDVAEARLMGLPVHVEIFDVAIEDHDFLSLQEFDDLVNIKEVTSIGV